MIDIKIQKKLYGAKGLMPLQVDLQIQEGEFVALSGTSGSGKTTLLRILAGLEEASGEIQVGSEIWLREQKALPPQKREIGFVFQDYALFENMTIEQNLLFVANNTNLAAHLLELTELRELKNRYPSSLSGGQKQRVSICRALMRKPKILLLDEPLSALDAAMRAKLQNELLTLHKEFGTTTIMVSHDPSEIYRLASRVVVLDNGSITNDGKPTEVLLKRQGSQKFSFEGELLEIKKVDVIYIAIVAIGQQLVEIVISQEEAKNLQIGDTVNVSTKAFNPNLT
ncbi:ABC transporter ATP-binding protein [Sulfurimonas paralvinellae]|uniref:ATP-binding cassette domain-containing protein n=1 Tax=Sulfurimonas paralvinellae TaxID=317658 RepID=A0A7M1BA36_9BACT|nr:ATP-binding cassette domain-containing protein [Sulfurimonas paralvinellae]QOP46491.1 ATP-binding cassette domain-containing protein [Sulfurimonas paralvinellae]